MAASIQDNAEKIVFQCDLAGNPRRIRKTSYVVFETRLDNGLFQVDLLIRLKAGFVKNRSDLIKNDHMIFQKRGEACFLLFEADKKDFRSEEDKPAVFEEDAAAADYDYRILIQKNPEASVKIEDETPAAGASGALNRINSMLARHGISEEETSSLVDGVMKTWKLGHPDEN